MTSLESTSFAHGSLALDDNPTGLHKDVVKAMPLVCTGHSRPVTHLSFSNLLLQNDNLDELV